MKMKCWLGRQACRQQRNRAACTGTDVTGRHPQPRRPNHGGTGTARQRALELYPHAFLDGRDTRLSLGLTAEGRGLSSATARLGRLTVRTILCHGPRQPMGLRRVPTGYRPAKAPFTSASASAGLEAAHQRDDDDEFVQATVIQSDGEAPE